MEAILSILSPAEEIVRQHEARAILLALSCAVLALLLSFVAIVRSGRSARMRGAVNDLHVRARSLENAEERRLLAGIRGGTTDDEGAARRQRST